MIIKEGESEERVRTLYGMICGGVGIFLNIILFIIKLLAGIMSGAVSVMADAMNNLSDAGASFVTLLGIKLSTQKPDREHPYGHGRIEYITAFIVSIIIILMGFELLKESVIKIIHPEDLTVSPLMIAILVIAIITKGYMMFYNFSVGNKIDSAPVKATAFDSLSDSIATTLVLVSALIQHYTGLHLDGYAGCVVSLFIFYAGYSAAKEALSPLLGRSPDPEFIRELEDIVCNFNPNILGLHDLMVHDYGPGNVILSLHAEVPASGNILELHDIIDNLEATLAVRLSCLATIHIDPIEIDNPVVNELRDKITDIAHQIDERIKPHDFRVVFGDTHTNLIFDLAVPFECPLANEEIMTRTRNLIWEEIGSNYFAVIVIDRDNYIN